jgi:hypothetical protein
VVVGNDELHPLQATGKKAFEKPSPTDFRLGCWNLTAQHATVVQGFDPNGNQDGAIDDFSLQADLLVTGIDKETIHLAQGAFPPGFGPSSSRGLT